LISKKLTAERPDATLAVICGAVTKAHIASQACWLEYKRILDKGQVPARDVLKTAFGIDFIYENVRFSFTVTRSSWTTWTLYLNGGRLMVDAKTCLIEQENDPTQLRSPSPGKLVRFLVESGDHINAGEQYAEIEVRALSLALS
jgi:acetyl-CoA carboxylase/biotin carboxylase 1